MGVGNLYLLILLDKNGKEIRIQVYGKNESLALINGIELLSKAKFQELQQIG